MKKILNKLKKLSQKTNNKNFFNWLYVFLLIILVFNIYFSQNLSPVFFNLVNNDKKAAISFLKNIRRSPEFEKQIEYFENIYGSSIKDDVFEEEIQRELEIKKLELILKKNSQSRDVLYRLYQLYLEKGDQKTAFNYLKQVKKIDPQFFISDVKN